MRAKVWLAVCGISLLFAGLARADESSWVVIRQDGVVGCDSKDSYYQFVKMGTDDDVEAMAAMVAEGTCEFLKRGTRVRVVDVHLFSFTAEVRRKGSTRVLWTAYEVVAG